ncbi:AsmA-like C-terminal region-containing protein, partial [Methyloceanibacter methanicus]|uniref:AsmA family protein n=1 Tax=Methyloceanibacter methanicus TaxID=1774968 RepID=UPI00114CAC12
MSAKTLSLGKPFQIADGKLKAKVDGGSLTVESMDGELFGGTFAGSGALAPRGSGAAFTAKAELKGGNLSALSEAVAGAPLATGPFDLSIDVAGEGLSPPGIVADLGGKGAFTLGAGELTSFTAAPLRQIADKAAASNVAATKEQIDADAETIRGELKNGRYAFAPVTLDYEVKNGTLRFAPASLAGKGVETALETYVDLVGLKLDSEWQMRLTHAQFANVPPLTVVFAGPLDEAGTIAPAVGTAAIENKLTIDRLREDVERLESLDVSGGRDPSAAEAAAKAAAEKAEAEKAAAQRAAAEAEAKKAAAQKVAAEKAAREQAEAEAKAAAEKAEAERIATQKAAAEKAAREAAEAEAAKIAAEKAARDKAEAEARAAEQKAAAERATREAEEAAQRAAAEAEKERAAAEARAAAEERAAAEARAATEARAAAEAKAAAR